MPPDYSRNREWGKELFYCDSKDPGPEGPALVHPRGVITCDDL
jgi:hypothetical protein